MGLLDKVAFNVKKVDGDNPEIAECERKLGVLEQNKKEVIYQLGVLFESKNDENSVAGTEYEPLMKKIAEIKNESDLLEKRILAVQGLRKCDKCDNILPLESAFCNLCGEKLSVLFENKDAERKVCSRCGAALVDGAMFCTSCGAKVEE